MEIASWVYLGLEGNNIKDRAEDLDHLEGAVRASGWGARLGGAVPELCNGVLHLRHAPRLVTQLRLQLGPSLRQALVLPFQGLCPHCTLRSRLDHPACKDQQLDRCYTAEHGDTGQRGRLPCLEAVLPSSQVSMHCQLCAQGLE